MSSIELSNIYINNISNLNIKGDNGIFIDCSKNSLILNTNSNSIVNIGGFSNYGNFLHNADYINSNSNSNFDIKGATSSRFLIENGNIILSSKGDSNNVIINDTIANLNLVTKINNSTDSTNISNGSFINLGGMSVFKNMYVGQTLNSIAISSSNIFNTNISSTNILSTNLTTTNGVFTDLSSSTLRTTSASIGSLSSGNLFSTNLTTTNGVFTDLSSSTLRTTNASIGALSSGNLFSTNLTTINGVFTDLSSSTLRTTTASIGSLSSGNLFSTNLTTINGVFTDLSSSTLRTTNASIGTLSSGSLFSTNLTTTNGVFTDLSSSTLRTTTASIGSLSSINCFLTNLSSSSASIGSLTSGSLFSTNLTTTNGVFTNLSSTTLSITSASIGSLSSGSLNSESLNSTNLTTTNAILTNLSSKSVYSQNIRLKGTSGSYISGANINLMGDTEYPIMQILAWDYNYSGIFFNCFSDENNIIRSTTLGGLCMQQSENFFEIFRFNQDNTVSVGNIAPLESVMSITDAYVYITPTLNLQDLIVDNTTTTNLYCSNTISSDYLFSNNLTSFNILCDTLTAGRIDCNFITCNNTINFLDGFGENIELLKITTGNLLSTNASISNLTTENLLSTNASITNLTTTNLISNSGIFLDNLTINGNLTVNGTTSNLVSENTIIQDNLLNLNSGPFGTRDSGIVISRFQTQNSTGTGDIVNDVIAESYSISAGSTSLTISLPNTANPTNNYYNNWYFKITAGASGDSVRKITGYTGSSRTLSFNTAIIDPSDGDPINLYNRPFVGLYYTETNDRFNLSASTTDPTDASSGNINITSYLPLAIDSLYINNSSNSTNNSSGAVYCNGGISISNSTDSTNISNGGSFTSSGGGAFNGTLFCKKANINGIELNPNPQDLLTTQFFTAGNNNNGLITNLSFNNSNTWGFDIFLSARLNATTSLSSNFSLKGVYLISTANWQLSTSYIGDNMDILFGINNSGDISYTSSNYSGFINLIFRYKCITN